MIEAEEQEENTDQEETHPVWDNIAADDFYYYYFIDYTRTP